MSGEIVRTEALEKEISPVLAQAQAIVVKDQVSRDGAMAFLKNIKGALGKIAELFDPIETAQKAARKVTIEQRAKLDSPLLQSEKEIKGRILTFDREIEEKRKAEERRLQAEADARAEAERQRLIKQAEKLKTPELREERIAQAEAVVAQVVFVAPAVQRTSGESTVGRWGARMTDKVALIKSAAEGNQLAIGFLAFDQVAANKQATASQDKIIIPGVEFKRAESLSVRS